MEAVVFTASALNYIVSQSVFIVRLLLKINHDFVSLAIETLKYLTDAVVTFTNSTCHVLHCYFMDFIIFLDEFGSVIMLIIQLFSSATSSMMCAICRELNVIIGFLSHLYSCFQTGYLNCIDFVSHVLQCIQYFLGVVFGATLLLLECIPESFVQVYKFVTYMINSISSGISHSAFVVCDIVYVLRMACVEAIMSIPAKAYIGFLMLSVMYSIRSKILNFVCNFFCRCSVIFSDVNYAFAGYVQRLIVACAVVTLYSFVMVYDWLCVLVRVPSNSLSYVQALRRISAQGMAGSSRPRAISPANIRTNFSNMKNVFARVRAKRRLFSADDDDDDIENESILSLQAELNREKDRRLCIVCQDKERNVILLPCRHLCLCEGCCSSLQNEFTGCPLCRQHIIDSISVFV